MMMNYSVCHFLMFLFLFLFVNMCVCLCSLLLTDLTFVISLHSLRLNHLHICSYSFLFVNVL